MSARDRRGGGKRGCRRRNFYLSSPIRTVYFEHSEHVLHVTMIEEPDARVLVILLERDCIKRIKVKSENAAAMDDQA